MALTTNRLAAATGVAAAFSLLATPAVAVDLPKPAAVKAYDGEALNAENRRRGRWYHDDDDIDAGDVVAGVLIFGAIAAIAGAANASRERADTRPQQRYPIPGEEPPYQAQGVPGRYNGAGMADAVENCIGEIERSSGAVGSVDAASRSVEGWHVSGSLDSGEPFSCSVGSDGSVSGVEVGAYETGYEAEADVAGYEFAEAQ